MAIYVADIVLRRNHYDGIALSDETPRSRFFYIRGVNPAGAIALFGGVAAAALCVDTAYTGPVALLAGVDLAVPVGIVVSAAVCAALMLTGRDRAH